MRKIETLYQPPPIPNRSYDWMATWDNYERGQPIGFGATEAEAVRELIAETEARDERMKRAH